MPPNNKWVLNGALRLLRVVKGHLCEKELALFCCSLADHVVSSDMCEVSLALDLDCDESLPSQHIEDELKGIDQGLAHLRKCGHANLGNAGNLKWDIRGGPERKSELQADKKASQSVGKPSDGNPKRSASKNINTVGG